jgi:hypothetical protein
VSLDQQTFEALKNRGSLFLAEDDAATVAAQPAAPQDPQTVDAANAGTAQPALTDANPAAASDAATAASPAGEGTAQETAAADVNAGESQPPVAYPPGRMSLGRKLPSANAETEPVSWWDQLMDTISGE